MFSPGYYFAKNFLRKIEIYETNGFSERSMAEVILEGLPVEEDDVVVKFRELKTVARQRVTEEEALVNREAANKN